MSPSNRILRTCAIRTDSSSLGNVYKYEAGGDFQRAWKAVHEDRTHRHQSQKSRGSRKWMPTASLQIALRLHATDLVQVTQKKGTYWYDNLFLLTREPVDEWLKEVLAAWEMTITGKASTRLAGAVGDLRRRHVSVEEAIEYRTGQTPAPPPWAYKVATWEVAQRLRTSELIIEDGSSVPMRLDTEGELLSWDEERLHLPSKDGYAHYRVQLDTMTVPGIEDLVVQAMPSISRLTRHRGEPVKRGWVNRGRNKLLLQAKIGWDTEKPSQRSNRAMGARAWRDRAVEVLEHFDQGLPDPDSDPGEVRDKLRMIPENHSRNHPIGKGATQLFHDAVAHWLRRAVPEADPLVFQGGPKYYISKLNDEEGAQKKRPSEKRLADMVEAAEQSPLMLVLYENWDVQHRVREALKAVFHATEEQLNVKDGTIVTLNCGLKCVFRSLPADSVLTQYGDGTEAVDTVAPIVDSYQQTGRDVLVIAETLSGELVRDGKHKDAVDPKKQLRTELAKKGVLTQFIQSNRAVDREELNDDPNYAGRRSVWDLMRSAGLFPAPLSVRNVKSNDPPCLIGAYCVHRDGTRYQSSGYDLVLVATKPAEKRFIAYDHRKGDGWQSIGRATTNLHSEGRFPSDQDKVGEALASGLRQLKRRMSGPYILFGNQTLSHIWNFVGDKYSDVPVPEVLERMDAAVVRSRSGRNLVPKPAGNGRWDEPDGKTLPKPPRGKDTGFVLNGAEPSAFYYVAESKTFSRKQAHRDNTRIHMTESDRREDNHSLVAREFWVAREGAFDALNLGKYAAFLCRFSLNWEGTLRHPVPLHLAKAVSDDHPRTI